MDFADGGASIETNAGVAERAVQYLNSIKTGSRKLDLAGHSMGGVVARYALASMEQRGIAHNVGRYVSLDAPHQGAVLDQQLQQWLKDLVDLGPLDLDDVPPNIRADAGKQFLAPNLLDPSVPSRRQQFAQLLSTTNGDGYPHQTTENIGVSFGAATLRNPNEGQVWLRVLVPLVTPNPAFEIEPWAPEAQPGSYLPRGSTELWGKVAGGLLQYEFVRLLGPTFIPYASALDVTNGLSRFDGLPIAPAEAQSHDQFPVDIVEPLLVRLGYPMQPVDARIYGPSTVPGGSTGEWLAHSSTMPAGGVGPYGYRWAYRLTCNTPPPCTGICIGTLATTMGVPDPEPCGQWIAGGSDWEFSHVGSYMYRSMTVRLTVTDMLGAQVVKTRAVTFGIARPAPGDSLSSDSSVVARDAAETSADAPAALFRTAGVPAAFALHAVAPNPSAGRAVVRFDVPEASDVSVVVVDLLGREVARLVGGRREAGTHEAPFDGRGLPPGVYVVRMQAGPFAAAQRMTLVR